MVRRQPASPAWLTRFRSTDGSRDGIAPTPLAEQVASAYDQLNERIRHGESRIDRTLVDLHRRLLGVGAATPNKPAKAFPRKRNDLCESHNFNV